MGQFGDTTLTKVFVGGLAWETEEKALREHFERYGEIHEAVIIYDKLTGRSKGYGFVTFKEAEAATKACENSTPVINGRRANCNIASLGAGARRARAPVASATPASQQPGWAIGVTTSVTTPPPPPPPPANNGHWYYPPGGAPHPTPFPHHYHGHPMYATYGYTPPYVADMGYDAKLNPSTGGHYIISHSPYAPQGGMVAPNGMFPVYPYYHYHQQPQRPQTMGLPSRPFASVAAAPTAVAPAIVNKPTAMPQATVEHVTG